MLEEDTRAIRKVYRMREASEFAAGSIRGGGGMAGGNVVR